MLTWSLLGRGHSAAAEDLDDKRLCSLGGTSQLGGRAEVVRLYPISAWAWGCFLGNHP